MVVEWPQKRGGCELLQLQEMTTCWSGDLEFRIFANDAAVLPLEWIHMSAP